MFTEDFLRKCRFVRTEPITHLSNNGIKVVFHDGEHEYAIAMSEHTFLVQSCVGFISPTDASGA